MKISSPSLLRHPGELPQGPQNARTTPERRLPVVDHQKVDPELLKAAQGMEAMFLDYLMKTMRETVPENALGTDSPATKIYQGMLDTEVAQRAAYQGRGVGLADQIIAYTQAQQYTLRQDSSTGGTDEDRPDGK